MSTREFHQRADELQQGGANGARFRRRSTLCETESDRTVVPRAVASAKQGDHEALRYLYIRYADNVYSYVSTLIHDDHEAEDVTQHVFAKLMTVLPKYEERDVPFAAWIMRVARNVAVDHLRQRRAIPSEEVRPDGNDWEDELAWQRSLELRAALASLPDDQRYVLVLRHVVGLTPGEIAGRMGKTEPSIHGLHHRGRSALRSALAQRECTPAVNLRAAA